MIRVHDSPGLGKVLIYDTPFRPGLAPWLPAFHVSEIPLLSKPVVTLDDWKAVVLVKQVFPGAYVTEVIDLAAQKKRRERWEKRQRTRLWSSGRSLPAPAQDD